MIEGVNQSLIGFQCPSHQWAWTSSDTILYALAVGATLESEFDYLYEGRGPKVLPGFAVLPSLHAGRNNVIAGLDLSRLLHGEQAIVIHRTIPASAEVTTRRRCSAVWDKGEDAVIEWVSQTSDRFGPLIEARSSTFVRGGGGFGGERGPSSKASMRPDGPPDTSFTLQTARDQAALYRLCGDDNPLHIDPEFARKAGFDRPILHGLCTYGVVLRGLTATACAGDASRIDAFEGRFAGVVYPGEEFSTQLWILDPHHAAVEVVGSRGPVLTRGRLQVREPFDGPRS